MENRATSDLAAAFEALAAAAAKTTDAARGLEQATAIFARPPQGLYGWQRARYAQQIREWFPESADFILTFDAPLAAEANDATWCARVEHELYHCAQRLDQYGCLKFNADGSPDWAMRGHDFEGFLGVSRRYGVGAAEKGVAEVVRVAGLCPEVALADVAGACGVCIRAA